MAANRSRRRIRSGAASVPRRQARPRTRSIGPATIDEAAGELQERVGNRAVATVLREADPKNNGKGPLSDLLDFDVPGLDVASARRLRTLLGKRQRQQAVDLIVAVLAGRGEIDVKLLHKSTMHYGPSVAGEGEALPPGYDTNPTTGKRTARPTVVRLGKSAFKDPSVLYSTVVHEYRHVLQFQSARARGTEGQRSLDWLIERQEVEAYAEEIFRARESGLWWQPAEMREIWRRLHADHWLGLGPKGKALLNDIYVRAHGLAQRAVGRRWKLPFRPKT